MHQLLWSGGWGFTDDMLIGARGTAAPACLHFFRVSSVHAAAADQSSCNCRGVAKQLLEDITDVGGLRRG